MRSESVPFFSISRKEGYSFEFSLLSKKVFLLKRSELEGRKSAELIKNSDSPRKFRLNIFFIFAFGLSYMFNFLWKFLEFPRIINSIDFSEQDIDFFSLGVKMRTHSYNILFLIIPFPEINFNVSLL